ncbi:hypothetical protein HDU78_006602 [Chytriomyces hyalinus]|nr:hypothetical protein HDU78_006602 [Chytriomyces hyalinus]
MQVQPNFIDIYPLVQRLGETIGALEGRIETLETNVGALQARNQALETSIGALQDSNQALETKIAQLESKEAAIISTLAPGDLVASDTPRADTTTFKNMSQYGVVVTFKNMSQYGVVVNSTFVSKEATIDLGRHRDDLVIISIPELGLHHIYNGNHTQLEWKGFPNRLIVAPDATSLIPPTCCFTEENVDADANMTNITVTNMSQHKLPIQVWNGSEFKSVLFEHTCTLPTTQFATVVVRDPTTLITSYYQGIARNLTFNRFHYPSELRFDNGFYFHAQQNGDSLRLRNVRSGARYDSDQVVFHRKDTQWPTLHIIGTLTADKPVSLLSESSGKYLDGRRDSDDNWPILVSRDPKGDKYLRWKVTSAL